MALIKEWLMMMEENVWFLLSKEPTLSLEQLKQKMIDTYDKPIRGSEWIIEHVWNQHKEMENMYYDG